MTIPENIVQSSNHKNNINEEVKPIGHTSFSFFSNHLISKQFCVAYPKRQSFSLRRFGVVYYVFAKAISFFFGRFAPGTERIYSAAAFA